MSVELLKSVLIELCENIYALGISKYDINKDSKLKLLVDELEVIEDKIRLCDDILELEKYKLVLEKLDKEIGELVNE